MRHGKTSEEELDRMIEEATVDCYGEYEEFMGILCHLEDNMSFPFKAKTLGDIVEVIRIDAKQSNLGRGMKARIRKEGNEYTIGLDELELGPGDTENTKLLEMYEYWISRF